MPEIGRAETVTAAPAQKNSESDPESWTDWETLYARSLEVRSYSVKAWETQRRAKTAHGNPLTPREPDYFGPEVRKAARMCDLANSGMSDARYGPRRRGRAFAAMSLDELAAAAERFGLRETEAEKAARKGIALDQWHELTEAAGAYSVDAMFELADLTGAERVVWELIVSGRDSTQICIATGKAHGTVHALRNRGLKKIRALRPREAA